MLRLIVLILLLANGAYFAWSQGLLASIGFAPKQHSEPQRMQAQIKPEAIRLLSPTEAKRVEALAAAPAPKAPECLQTPLLTDSQANAAQAVLAAWPSGSWSLNPSSEPSRWIVYMGKYPNAEAVAKKKSELRELGLPFEPLRNAALEPGISLGVYDNQSAASVALANLSKRGVRTAKVLLETPERSGQILKLPAVDEALRAQLEVLKPALGGSSLALCKA